MSQQLILKVNIDNWLSSIDWRIRIWNSLSGVEDDRNAVITVTGFQASGKPYTVAKLVRLVQAIGPYLIGLTGQLIGFVDLVLMWINQFRSFH